MKSAIAALSSVIVLAACKSEEQPKAPAEPPGPPPPIRVTADRTDLVYSYAKNARTFATAASVDEIPEDRRSAVVVTDLSLSPEERQAGTYIYVANLTSAGPDGAFPVAVASRYGFEADFTGTSTSGGAAGGDGVVIYTTSWCGACKKAKRLLRSWKVPFEEKDIEASAKAKKELAEKAAAVGVQPRGVPVIDVAGELMMGLDEATLRRTLQKKNLL